MLVVGANVLKLFKCVVEGSLFTSDLVRSTVIKFLEVFDSNIDLGDFKSQLVEFLSLVVCFVSFCLTDFIQMVERAVVLDSLSFSTFNFMLKRVQMTLLILDINSSGIAIIAEFLGFYSLLTQQLLGSVSFIRKFVVDFGLLLNEELKFFKLTTLVTNFTTLSIDSESRVVLRSCLVIRHHPVAVFERVNFVIYATVVSFLVSEVVELLTQLSDKLIFFALSDLDA